MCKREREWGVFGGAGKASLLLFLPVVKRISPHNSCFQGGWAKLLVGFCFSEKRGLNLPEVTAQA